MLAGRQRKLEDEASALEAADAMSATGASPEKIAALSDDNPSSVKSEKIVSSNNNRVFSDPSFPLADKQREDILQALAAGLASDVAYQQAGHPHATRKTAQQQVSRMLREPRFSARLQWLRSRRRAQAEAQDTGDDHPMTRAEMERRLSADARRATDPNERIAAMKLLHSLRGGQDETKAPDPAFVLEYLRKASEQGKNIMDTTTGCGFDDEKTKATRNPLEMNKPEGS